MVLPDGRPLVLDDDVLREASASAGRVVLWLRGERAGGYQHWDRVGTTAHAGFADDRGIRAAAAALVPARRWVGGPIGGLIRRLGNPKADRSWTLPGGGTADQCGPRRTDLVLAWSANDADPIDEATIRARWEGARWARSIGRDVYLVGGIGPAQLPDDRPPGPVPVPLPQPSLRQLAGLALASARDAGDARRELTALADLALAYRKEGDAGRAVELLEEALAGAIRLGDRAQEAGIRVDLGRVATEAGRLAEARAILRGALVLAREVGDRYAEKLALERLGHVDRCRGDHPGALDFYEQALALAADLGDVSHEAGLLWQVAIEHADIGWRDRAGAYARASVDRMRRLGRPQAEWYAHHLANFQSDARGGLPRASRVADDGEGLYLGATIDTEAIGVPAPPPTNGPGPLHMALTAAASMVTFLGSGFRVTGQDALRVRIEACASCEHHTGLRCRVCGCFTAAKARLAHERCPVGRWTAV